MGIKQINKMKRKNVVAWSNAVYAAHQAIKDAENRDYGDELSEGDLKRAIAHLVDALALNN